MIKRVVLQSVFTGSQQSEMQLVRVIKLINTWAIFPWCVLSFILLLLDLMSPLVHWLPAGHWLPGWMHHLSLEITGRIYWKLTVFQALGCKHSANVLGKCKLKERKTHTCGKFRLHQELNWDLPRWSWLRWKNTEVMEEGPREGRVSWPGPPRESRGQE